jgi:hypothetical protein
MVFIGLLPFVWFTFIGFDSRNGTKLLINNTNMNTITEQLKCIGYNVNQIVNLVDEYNKGLITANELASNVADSCAAIEATKRTIAADNGINDAAVNLLVNVFLNNK